MVLKRFFAVFGFTLIVTTADAAVIIDNTFAGATINTFDPGATGSVLGFITQTGATYGESFAGQTLSVVAGFDVLSGVPTAPLTLQSNPVAADNIGLLFNSGSNTIYGDLRANVGEGALSILFGSGVSGLGLNVVGTNSGAFTVQFFDPTGALLAAITQPLAADAYFGFRATAGSIIAGVSITNTDPAGVAYDNVQFSPAQAPEPMAMTLMSLSVLAFALRRRKR